MIDLPKTIATPSGYSVEGASAALLVTLLEEYGSELQERGVPVAEGLARGVDVQHTRSTFAELGLVPPQEVEVWFGWQNGAVAFEGRSVWLLPRIEPWSIRTVVDSYSGRERGSETWEWHPRWVQLAGEKEGIAVWFSEDPLDPPLVRAIEWGEGMQPGDPSKEVVSLCTVVTWWLDGLRSGRYTWDRDTWSWATENPKVADPRNKTLLL